jgi:hypothetical protein
MIVAVEEASSQTIASANALASECFAVVVAMLAIGSDDQSSEVPGGVTTPSTPDHRRNGVSQLVEVASRRSK